MQNGTNTVESSVEVPQKIEKRELLYNSEIPLLSIYSKG
jgi:hypothetical protein